MATADSTQTAIVYKDIPGVRGRRATSLGTIETCLGGRGIITQRWRPMKAYDAGGRGNLLVSVRRDGKTSPVSIRVLVLEAFRGPCPDGCESWAKNGDLGDTRPSNLVWAPIECTRLWYRVEMKESGCWEWQGAKRTTGYGNIKYLGKWYGCHQLAYSLAVGPIPGGLHVLHHCDNPPCCNPEHLFVGTNTDNIKDRMVKDRSNREPVPYEKRAKGERVGGAKLTEDLVRAVRDRHAEGGMTMREVGDEFGVCAASVCLIVNRKTWAHV